MGRKGKTSSPIRGDSNGIRPGNQGEFAEGVLKKRSTTLLPPSNPPLTPRAARLASRQLSANAHVRKPARCTDRQRATMCLWGVPRRRESPQPTSATPLSNLALSSKRALNSTFSPRCAAPVLQSAQHQFVKVRSTSSPPARGGPGGGGHVSGRDTNIWSQAPREARCLASRMGGSSSVALPPQPPSDTVAAGATQRPPASDDVFMGRPTTPRPPLSPRLWDYPGYSSRCRRLFSGRVRKPQSSASSWMYCLPSVRAVVALANSYPR